MPERSLEEVRCFVGNGVENLIQKAVDQGTTEKDFRQCLSIFKEHYVKHCQEHTRLYEGIAPLIKTLHNKGVHLAIVSNKLQAGVDELYSKNFADNIEVAIGEHNKVNRKPSPDMVYEAISRLGVNKEECLYVGDSEVDVLTARNAGLMMVSVLWGFRTREDLERVGATTFISQPSELLKFFED